jgi:hypothetical protein
MWGDYDLALRKELCDLLRNEFARILKRKVAGIEQVKLRLWNIAQIGLRALDGEERIVLSPHNKVFGCLFRKNSCQPS